MVLEVVGDVRLIVGATWYLEGDRGVELSQSAGDWSHGVILRLDMYMHFGSGVGRRRRRWPSVGHSPTQDKRHGPSSSGAAQLPAHWQADVVVPSGVNLATSALLLSGTATALPPASVALAHCRRRG